MCLPFIKSGIEEAINPQERKRILQRLYNERHKKAAVHGGVLSGINAEGLTKSNTTT